MIRKCLLLLLGSLLPVAFAQTAVERVLFSRAADETLRIQVNASEGFSARDLAGRPEGLTRDGVTFENQGGTISMAASRRPVAFEILDFAGFKGELPPNCALSLKISLAQGSLQATANSANGENSVFTFVDSARALLPAGSKARADFLSDGAYFLTGSSNVTAVTADGVPIDFSQPVGPMLGGRLEPTTDARGNARLKRSTPLVELHLSGSPDQEVQIASQAFSGLLIPGQERLLVFTNGSRILVKQDRAKAQLEWRVLRGVCQFSIAGFSCWTAEAMGGHAGSLQWNPAKRAVDLHHSAESEDRSDISARVSGRLSASVTRGATFQYIQFQDCGSFAVAALGEVRLFDRETGEVIPILQTPISFNEGMRVGASAASGGNYTPIILLWETEARFQLRGGGTTFTIAAGTEQTVRFAGDELRASYRTDGSVELRSTLGNFTLSPIFVPSLAIDIPEGGALVLRLNRQRWIFMAQAAPDSAASLRVASGGQTYMYLAGEARLVVVLGQNSILPEGSPAWIFFEGAGGESGFTSGPQPGAVISPDRIDLVRITQEPVSVLAPP